MHGVRLLYEHLKNVEYHNRTLGQRRFLDGKPPTSRPATLNTCRKPKLPSASGSGELSTRSQNVSCQNCPAKPTKKRKGEVYASNLFERYYEHLSREDVLYNIDKILEYYAQLVSLGCTQKKLTQMARRLCMEKEDLVGIVLECTREDPLTDVISYTLRRDRMQIFHRLKEVAFAKDYASFEHVVSEVILFKGKLEEAVIEDRKKKIDNLSKSIREYRHQNSHCRLNGYFVAEEFAPKPGYDKMIGNALSNMERKYGGFRRITDYSLKVYGCLSDAEDSCKKGQLETRPGSENRCMVFHKK